MIIKAQIGRERKGFRNRIATIVQMIFTHRCEEDDHII